MYNILQKPKCITLVITLYVTFHARPRLIRVCALVQISVCVDFYWNTS